MAKTSSIEKNNRRRKMTKKFAAKRARLKAIAYDKAAAAGRAVRGPAQARAAAAQFVGDAHSQPLRGDRARRGLTTASSG